MWDGWLGREDGGLLNLAAQEGGVTDAQLPPGPPDPGGGVGGGVLQSQTPDSCISDDKHSNTINTSQSWRWVARSG